MAENKMKEVAKLLGVELGKPFNIKDAKFNPYTLTEDGLIDRDKYFRMVYLNRLLMGEYEIEHPILDDVEKRYLEGVLRPFKNRVNCVVKTVWHKQEYILISYKNDSDTPFPNFDKNTMYKGMELNKEYTLEELGLFKD